ncbi:sugar/nucleoside kinase (ribokinase family) [Kineosphaera limosa]|uniref:Carbohydrate kinase PfkB domain-containing protein n=1 Tax=Kineosphaera limosa NBRC 100340 TaxID=1184609 RepID=K6VMC7_9MICO|nr:PfkB family carbohydrate kinase [Kineosphaera limosa]NYE01807.1 sugar/nucleoside kinase (ribokinase family) [Kineosphaera limosa]GAB97358.1 hypothetical protein KILIM_065_00360 [Kineosphaera limosa NBRC 100340]
MIETTAARGVTGLFVGLATLDLIQRVPALPAANTKVTAQWQELSAGGPALNAAVTFAALRGHAVLITRVGSGTVGQLVTADLRRCGVTVVDAALLEPEAAGHGRTEQVPTSGFEPAVSAITVDASTADRQIVSTDAGRPTPLSSRGRGALQAQLTAHLSDAAVVLLDGHHPDLAHAVLDVLDACQAPDQPEVGAGPVPQLIAAGQRPVILDAGRWKPQLVDLLPRCTDIVCSADFVLPQSGSQAEASGDGLLEQLVEGGATLAAVSDGPRPIRWRTAVDIPIADADAAGGATRPDRATGAIRVPSAEAIDTLGAGDALHGGYAWGLASAQPTEHPAALDRIGALTFAARVASLSTCHLGTRSWLAAVPALLNRA